MTFTSPIWLTALLPWAGVVVYLLLGRRPAANVPFINLWRGPIHAPRVQRSMQRMPMWIALLLCAIAVSIFVASGPQIVDRPAASAPPIRQTPDVGIEALVVRGSQVMVRLLNESKLTHADLWLRTDSTKSFYPIDLPATGASQNYFFDLPARVVNAGATLNVAEGGLSPRPVEVARQRSWPVVEPMSPLPPEVRRIIDVYARHRPSSESSTRIGLVTGDPSQLAGNPGIALAEVSSTASGAVTVGAHPVTAGVTWSQVLVDAKLAADPPTDFTAVVSVAGRPVIAVREQPVRQVWIGFDSPAFARSPEFVIFWTNLLDWVGQGGDTFQPVPGTVFATPSRPASPNPQKPGYHLSPWLACLAAGLSAVALAVAPKRVP